MDNAVNYILDIIEGRLANITVANGYSVTVKNPERARLTPWKGYDLPAINYWSTGVQSRRNQYAGDERSLALFVEIHSQTNDRPFIDVAGELAGDVVTALNRSVSAPAVSDLVDLDLGGLVSDLIFDGYDYEIGEGQAPWCGALVKFTVKYNTYINDIESFSS